MAAWRCTWNSRRRSTTAWPPRSPSPACWQALAALRGVVPPSLVRTRWTVVPTAERGKWRACTTAYALTGVVTASWPRFAAGSGSARCWSCWHDARRKNADGDDYWATGRLRAPGPRRVNSTAAHSRVGRRGGWPHGHQYGVTRPGFLRLVGGHSEPPPGRQVAR